MPLTTENKEPQQKKHGALVKEELLVKIQNARQELRELKQSNNLTLEEKNNRIEVIEPIILECSKELEILKTDTENLTDRTGLKYLESNIRNLEFEIENLKIYIEQQIKEEMESLNGIITEEKNIELEEKGENTNNNENISEGKLGELQLFESQCKDLRAKAVNCRELSHYYVVDFSNNAKDYKKILENVLAFQKKSYKVYSEILNTSDDSQDINQATNIKNSIDTIVYEILSMKDEIYNNITEKGPIEREKTINNNQENEDIQMLNEISFFIEDFDKINLSSWEDVYNDDRAKEIILELFEYVGIQRKRIQGSDDLKSLINQLEKKAGIHVKNVKDIYIILANNLYRTNLQNMAEDIYLTSFLNWNNRESGKDITLIKEKAFICLECLDRIGTLKEEELNGKYKGIYLQDLQALNFDSLLDLKKERNLDTISALEYAKKYGKQAYESKMLNGITYNTLTEKYGNIDHIYAPGAYEKLLYREKEYIDYAGYTLSLDDYNKLFHDFYLNHQGNVGNCYLIASIRSLARTPYFDTLVRTSIIHNSDGSYTVRVPLGEPKGESYTIYEQEFGGETYTDDRNNSTGQDSWYGPLGYRLLELAYVKYINGYKRNVTNRDVKEIESGTTAIALEALLGEEGYKVDQYPRFNISRKEPVLERLKNFNPGRGDVITMTRWFKIGGHEEICDMHVYSVIGVKKDERGEVVEVVIENPHYEHENHTLKIDDFFSIASNIECGHITDNFLNKDTLKNFKVITTRDKYEHHRNCPYKETIKFMSEHQWKFDKDMIKGIIAIDQSEAMEEHRNLKRHYHRHIMIEQWKVGEQRADEHISSGAGEGLRRIRKTGRKAWNGRKEIRKEYIEDPADYMINTGKKLRKNAEQWTEKNNPPVGKGLKRVRRTGKKAIDVLSTGWHLITGRF